MSCIGCIYYDSEKMACSIDYTGLISKCTRRLAINGDMDNRSNCISCRHLISRNCKWFCGLVENKEVSPDLYTCYCYSEVESVEGAESSSLEKFKKELRAVLDDDFDFLVEKNRQYGDSALDPLRIFSKSSTKEQIFVRMDDKLSRIKRGDAKIEDTFRDLRNYLNLLEVLERRERAEGEKK